MKKWAELDAERLKRKAKKRRAAREKPITAERLARLPLWAQDHIEHLQRAKDDLSLLAATAPQPEPADKFDRGTQEWRGQFQLFGVWLAFWLARGKSLQQLGFTR